MLHIFRGCARLWCWSLPCLFALCTGVVDAQESSSFDTLAAKAEAAREAGRSEDAVRYYTEAVRLQAQWEEGWWYLGSLLYDADRFADAVAPFHRVTELDPKLGPAWGFLGLCEYELGRNAESLEHLRRAEGLGFAEYPQLQKVAMYHLALLLNAAGEFEKASKILVAEFASGRIPDQIQLAMGMSLLRIPLLPAQLDPSKDALVHAAGETAAFLAEKNFDAALSNFSGMAKNYPDTPYLHYAYGNAQLAAGKSEQAKLEFREESRINSTSPLPWIALASVALREGRPTDALESAKRAEQIAPDSAVVHGVLADVYQALGKAESVRTERAHETSLAGRPSEIEPAQVARYSVKTGPSDSGISVNSSRPNSPDLAYEEIVRQGEAAQQSGHLDDAANFYKSALQMRPDWDDGWRRLGTIAYMQRQYSEAVAALQRAVKAGPKHADSWTLLGLSEFELKDFKNARLHLDRANDLGFRGNESGVKFAAYHLAILLVLEGRFDRATDILIPLVGVGPMESEIQFAMGLAMLRIALLPEQVETGQRLLVSQAGAIAAQLAQRHYEQAFPMFDALLLEYPKTPFVQYAYGAALANISDFDRAQAHLRDEIAISPESPLPYIRLASVLLTLHRSEEALNLARKAVKLAPESPDSYYVLGRAFLEIGDNENAVKELETARQLAPGSPAVRFNLARAYTRVHRTADAEKERAEFQRLNQIMTGETPSQRAERGLSQASEGTAEASSAR